MKSKWLSYPAHGNLNRTLKLKCCVALISAGLLLIPSQALAAKDKIRKFKVLENTFSTDCPYMRDVALKVKYKLKSKEEGVVIVEGTEDGQQYFLLASKPVSFGKGTTIIGFNAGECLQDIRVSIE